MKSQKYLRALGGALVGVSLALPVFGHEGSHDGGGRSKALPDTDVAFPLIAVDGGIELRFDDFASGDWAQRRIDVNVHGDAMFGFYAAPGLSLQSHLKMESVREPKPGRDRFLRGTGLFLEELYIDYSGDAFGLYAGKFNPAFGLAWRKFGELLKEGFAEEYEIDGMNGFGGALKFDFGPAGRHEINAAVFFQDTSILHRSLLAQPGAGDERSEHISHLRRADGGLANTGALNSFAVALDGRDIAALPGLSYHLGFRRLHRGLTEAHDERALAGAIGYEFSLNAVTVEPFVELVRFWNMDGASGNGLVISAGLTVTYQRFVWQSGFSLRHANVATIDGPDTRDWMAGSQLVYDLGDSFGLGAGYRHQRVERVHSDQLRVFLAYQFGLSKSLAR